MGWPVEKAMDALTGLDDRGVGHPALCTFRWEGGDKLGFPMPVTVSRRLRFVRLYAPSS